MTAPLLLFDGDCAFCAGSVRFVLARDRHGIARFAAREGATGRAVLARHPAAAATDSLVWVEPGPGGERALVRSDAVLAIARHLGGGWGVLGRLGRLVPRPWRDRAYDVVARHRHRLTGGRPACFVPLAEERSRILD